MILSIATILILTCTGLLTVSHLNEFDQHIPLTSWWFKANCIIDSDNVNYLWKTEFGHQKQILLPLLQDWFLKVIPSTATTTWWCCSCSSFSLKRTRGALVHWWMGLPCNTTESFLLPLTFINSQRLTQAWGISLRPYKQLNFHCFDYHQTIS